MGFRVCASGLWAITFKLKSLFMVIVSLMSFSSLAYASLQGATLSRVRGVEPRAFSYLKGRAINYMLTGKSPTGISVYGSNIRVPRIH